MNQGKNVAHWRLRLFGFGAGKVKWRRSRSCKGMEELTPSTELTQWVEMVWACWVPLLVKGTHWAGRKGQGSFSGEEFF